MSGGKITRLDLPLTWQPRDHQLELYNYLVHEEGRRADVVAHRRWGKDEVALHWAAMAASKKPGTYWHLLPEASQARKAIWDAVNPHTGRRRIEEAFPQTARKSRNNAEMKIELSNGSVWQVGGADNYDSLVGSSPAGVVFSEWSLSKPEAWAYIRPILLENDGWALFLWTPRGRNHAVRAWEDRARRPGEWLTLKSSAADTGIFTKEQLDRERAELIAELGSEDEGHARFASEYLVEFDAPAPGAYYASLLGQAEREGRIGRVPYDPALKVDTAWDLGIDDYTTVWFFQQQGREVRAIDYFETSGDGLTRIVKEAISEKPYVYGTHHLPHDVMARELGTGRSRLETLAGLGLTNVSVGAAMDKEDRIHAGRLLIPLTWFDAERCGRGLDRLRAYRKRWNKATHSYGGPLHDHASHAADAFGEFAANRRGPVERRPPPRRYLGDTGPLSWMR
ncbi:hypothetical protein [Phenylobacterium sp.]|jgi:hypothetical protein|uniref:hypothetical protein n=1 Tax=Phenylobacterium sp. TaxID=1871053 RepID=UPI002F952F98